MSDRRIETLTDLPEATTEAVLGLIGTAAADDGQPAVSESGRLHVRGAGRPGVRHLLLWVPGAQDGDVLAGYGQIDGSDLVEAPSAEFVVHPAHRSHGHGRALGEALLAATGRRLRVWAHGGHPAARHLAVRLGLKLFRELRQMRRPLDPSLDGLPEPRIPDGITVRTFVPGQDDAAWLAANAAAFAHHPEQGSLTQSDLDDRKAEPWFDPAGFFLATRTSDEGDQRLVGFHWTKVHGGEGDHHEHPDGPHAHEGHGHDPMGEVYVVGVDPAEQGTGLGRALTLVGLRHLRHRGLPDAMLYVDADNAAAIRLYTGLGFTRWETDVMFSRDPRHA
jgi:mycothiol synthase